MTKILYTNATYVYGTRLDDVIIGGNRDQTFIAGSGSDLILAGGGQDTIIDAASAPVVNPAEFSHFNLGSGNDTYTSYDPTDAKIFGGSGNDVFEILVDKKFTFINGGGGDFDRVHIRDSEAFGKMEEYHRGADTIFRTYDDTGEIDQQVILRNVESIDYEDAVMYNHPNFL